MNKETLLKHKVLISSGTGEVPLLLPNVESLTSTNSIGVVNLATITVTHMWLITTAQSVLHAKVL